VAVSETLSVHVMRVTYRYKKSSAHISDMAVEVRFMCSGSEQGLFDFGSEAEVEE
jgi:hypothetical protein